jgi:hypothetical protein
MRTWYSKVKRVGLSARGAKAKQRRTTPWGRPAVELLEDRLAPATLTVNSVADNTQADAFLTLREGLLLVDNGGNAMAALGRSLTAGESAQISGTFGSNDTIQFDPSLSGQTITLGSTLPQLTANLNLTGPGASQLAVSGSFAVQVLNIAAGVTAQVSGLAIEGGYAFLGGAISNAGILTLRNSFLSGNFAPNDGGAISNAGTLTLTNSTLYGNSASGSGGAISNLGGTMTLTDCTLSRNQGGGAYYYGGGGVYNNGNMTLTRCQVLANTVAYYSGGRGYSSGGGILNKGALTIADSALSGNQSAYGGGGIDNQGTLTITNSTLTGNSNAGGFLTGGGGVLNFGTLTATDCTLAGNSTGFYSAGGGGISNLGTVTLTNSTVSGNSALIGTFYGGGGILNDNTLTLTNCTVAGNKANSGGGIAVGSGSTTLGNTIIANNQAFGGPDVLNGSGTTTLANSSLIQNTSFTIFAPGSANNITGQDPLLGPLQNNGGPTFTMALLPGSPAIDAGDNSLAVDADGNPLTTDQRGQPYVRIYGARVDMGAYDVQPLAVSVAIRPSAYPSDFGQALTFSATVSSSVPGAGTPTGSVDFVDTTTANDLGSVALSGGTASLTTTSLPLGPQSISAIYSGDASFQSGSGSASVSILPSIYVLAPTANPSLRLSGNTAITIPGLIQVDSSSPTALTASGNSSVRAGSIQVVGGFLIQDNASINPTPVTGVPLVPDPLAALPAPSGGVRQGSVNLTQGTESIDPGIYDQIQVSGTVSLTLNPGIYVIAGGGLKVTDLASITGSGVLIYNAGSNYVGQGSSFGGITLSSQATINLTPASTGPYAGILIFQSRDNASAISLNGKTAGAIQNSILYAPAARLSLEDNAILPDTLVVNQLRLGSDGSSPQQDVQTNASLDFGQALNARFSAAQIAVMSPSPREMSLPPPLGSPSPAQNGWDEAMQDVLGTVPLVPDSLPAELARRSAGTAVPGQSRLVDALFACRYLETLAELEDLTQTL